MMWRGHAPAAARWKGLIFFVPRNADAGRTRYVVRAAVPLVVGEPFAIDQHSRGEDRSDRVAERGRPLRLMLLPNSGILLGQKRTGIECRLERRPGLDPGQPGLHAQPVLP
jgi:hypothetical protein